MQPDRWAIVIMLEDIETFIGANPNEAATLSKNTALLEYLLTRLRDLYAVDPGEKVQ